MGTGPRVRASLSAVAISVLLAACATGGMPEPRVGPEDIPRLQQALAADPSNVTLKTELGIAYYTAASYEQAQRVLSEAIDEGATSGVAHLYLGLASEELQEWDRARDAYSSYVQVGPEGPLMNDVQARLLLMSRRALQEQVQRALQAEDELTAADPTPNTVGVFPFYLVSDNQDLAPLGVALADMMTTDLALSGGVTVLERSQVQMLLNEMALTEAGYTDPATGARAGRLLRAEHVVQGALTTLQQQVLRMDTDVLYTPQGRTIGDVTEEDQLEAIFDMEKEVVIGVIDILGIDLTPAEREAINENRAENLLAFLAYGQGLMAMDEGNFDQASQFFNQAVQLDPGFQAAQTRQGEAGSLNQATTTSTSTVGQQAQTQTQGTQTAGTQGSQGGSGDLLGSINDGVNSSPSTTMTGTSSTDGNPSGQPTSEESTSGAQNTASTQDSGVPPGGEGNPTSTATIKITIPRPPSGGGGQ